MSSESVCQVAHSWVDMGSFHTHLFGVVYMTCGDFHDESGRGTGSVHQILYQSWEKCYGDRHNDSTSLWGPKLELCTNASMACPVEDRSHIIWWWWTHRETHKLHNSRNCCTNSRARLSAFMTLLRRWELIMGNANRFWRKNWACTVSQPNLCPGSWQLTRSSSVSSAPNWTEKQNGCHPPPTAFLWFGTLWLLPISKNEIEAERTLVWYHWGEAGWIAESAWHSDRKGLPGSVPKMEETVGPVSTCGRELLRGWRQPIGLMVSFKIFTASVRKILDTTLYTLFHVSPVCWTFKQPICTTLLAMNFILLHSYACLNCITVLPNHFYCCLLPYVYIITPVTLELKSPAMGIPYSSRSLR